MADKKEGESKGTTNVAPPIAENLYATEIYADFASFFALKGGNISITSPRRDSITR
jgi:hypothetical protein